MSEQHERHHGHTPHHEPTSLEMTPRDAAESAAWKLFDLRIMIGGLFTVYGVALIIYSFFTTPADLAKASGININLWLGIGMLILGVFFLLWARLSPVRHERVEGDQPSGGRPVH
jgi:hypothetical protein